MAAGSKEGRSLKSQELARDHHAPRVTVTRESRWEFQRLFFPYHANLTPFAHSRRPVSHYIRAILQEITYEKVLGGSVIEDFGSAAGDRPKALEPAQRSKAEPKLASNGSIRCNVNKIDLPPLE
jgi:hypothetical protein